MSKGASPDEGTNMETVTSADRTEIAFERTGSGPPLVLIHGTSVDHRYWDLVGVAPAFAAQYTVYAIDRRGRGESGDAEKYGLEREVEDMVAVIESIDEPVVLLGHSFGALIALEAARGTENLRSLILYDLAAWGELNDHIADVGVRLKELFDAGEGEEALVMFLKEFAGLDEETIESRRAGPHWQDRVDAFHTVLREGHALSTYTFDLDSFETMTTPTLILLGGESVESFKQTSTRVSEMLPNARLLVLEGQDHVAWEDALDRFVDEVRSFNRETD